MNDTILQINSLSIKAGDSQGRTTELIKHINMKVKRNSICCIVGNSGSGKSLIAMSVMGIFADNLEVNGTIYFNGEDLLNVSNKKPETIRGKQIGIVMQNCAGALNPLLKNGKQLRSVMKNYFRGRERQRMIEVLRQVELTCPEQVLKQYPHELSGGMKQRLMTAIGMVNSPSLLIMDEPTKGMDFILRNQIADMIKKLHKDSCMTILLITHDLELAYKLSDYCYVMSDGKIVEENETGRLFEKSESNVFRNLLASERKMTCFFRGKDEQNAGM